MRLNDYVALRRGDRDSIRRMMEHCRAHLASGTPVLMFPEGTRSRDGRLQPFKDGAFRLAVETGTPILPLAVAGTRHAMAKGSFRFQRSHARVRVLAAIEVTGLTLDDVPSLREQTRAAIEQARTELARELQG
jgi:1-acyl-sn-glycerol-3-phosphate acyltransferase